MARTFVSADLQNDGLINSQTSRNANTHPAVNNVSFAESFRIHSREEDPFSRQRRYRYRILMNIYDKGDISSARFFARPARNSQDIPFGISLSHLLLS